MSVDKPQHKPGTPFQILSLSGGGIRGLYSITVLATLEEILADQTGDQEYSIARHFDMICGTSIGGILALGLASGINARELQRIIDNNRQTIFPQHKRWKIPGLRRFRLARKVLYSEAPLQKILEDTFAGQLIGELNTRVLIPSVNYSTGRVQVFKTPHLDNYKLDHRMKVTDVARATSAAPTFFPVFACNNTWYVDGGLAANSPALMAYHEAAHLMQIPREDIYLMRIGTMGQERTADPRKKRDAGYMKMWGMGEKLIELTLSANETLHDTLTAHLLSDNQILAIDEFSTIDQDNCLGLDKADDHAAGILKARGKASAQTKSNDQLFIQMSQHIAPEPTFHHGPKANHIFQETPHATN